MTEIDPPPPDWYGPVAAHLKEAYLRYAFTYGTGQEVEFLFGELGLSEGKRLLDVGCGPGRHAVEFARLGVAVVGIDLSPEFVAIGRRRAQEAGVGVSFYEMDARHLPFEEDFDAAVCLCEGAFGLGIDDLGVLRGMSRALRPGGRLAAGAPNVFYILAHMSGAGDFDPTRMLFREAVPVVGGDGAEQTFALYNSCYTPREMSWIANGAGLDALGVFGISPGDYGRHIPTRDHPELLLIAERPARPKSA